ncbi:hypothetical protein [Pelagibacterium montanilacus]|uniref:hypothetical protein n=1 Tax=Pelagibacterium montanilacus TaxID=2185280 RepID=UPI000F8D0035|nr:hypothetical protein [Pelagibacterium montanilacus]
MENIHRISFERARAARRNAAEEKARPEQDSALQSESELDLLADILAANGEREELEEPEHHAEPQPQRVERAPQRRAPPPAPPRMTAPPPPPRTRPAPQATQDPRQAVARAAPSRVPQRLSPPQPEVVAWMAAIEHGGNTFWSFSQAPITSDEEQGISVTQLVDAEAAREMAARYERAMAELQRSRDMAVRERNTLRRQMEQMSVRMDEMMARQEILETENEALHSDAAVSGNPAQLGLIRWAHDALHDAKPRNYDFDEVSKLCNTCTEVVVRFAWELGDTHGRSPQFWEAYSAVVGSPTKRIEPDRR